MDDDLIRKPLLWSHLALRIVRHHESHSDTEHTLTHSDMTNSRVNVVLLGLTSGDKIAVLEL